MTAKETAAGKKLKAERLVLIKERYHKLIMKQRQEIERELQDDFKQEEEFEVETEPAAEPETDFEVE
jgi:hypothetical protein